MQYAILAHTTFTNHPIIVLDLAGINVVDRFAAVFLADPFRRGVVLDDHLSGRTQLTNRQSRFIRIAPDDSPIPACLFRGLRLRWSLLGEHCHRNRECKYRCKQQSEQSFCHGDLLLQDFFCGKEQ